MDITLEDVERSGEQFTAEVLKPDGCISVRCRIIAEWSPSPGFLARTCAYDAEHDFEMSIAPLQTRTIVAARLYRSR
jgi:hypothetical protein